MKEYAPHWAHTFPIKIVSVRKEHNFKGFQFFVAVFASKGNPFKNMF